MLAPNKQNLLLLKSQSKSIRNGHKLLKEKRTGLILNFLNLASKGRELELAAKSKIDGLLTQYQQEMAFVSTADLMQELVQVACHSLSVNRKRVSGVYLDTLELYILPPTRDSLKQGIRQNLDGFARLFPQLIEISQLKLNCLKLSDQIQKTNRLIANLEQKMNDIDSQIKFISNTLNEKANIEKATLIRIFG